MGVLQVGYCQGMAFAAGVLLMYMPEEPAFRCGLLARAHSNSMHVVPFNCSLKPVHIGGLGAGLHRLQVSVGLRPHLLLCNVSSQLSATSARPSYCRLSMSFLQL